MKSFIALSFVFLRLFTSAYALPTTALGNFSVAATKPQRTGPYLKGDARAASLNDRASDGPITVPMPRGVVGVYVAEIGFGEPVQYSRLIVDTASSITWRKHYIEGPTTERTGRRFSLEYNSNEYCRANEFLDQVAIAPNLVITRQAVGGAFHSSDFDGLDGILGLGPVALTEGMIIGSNDAVPTVMNNLKSQGLIEEVFSVYFPSTAYTNENDEGKLTFGGVDTRLYEGDIRYVSLTEKSPASDYWGVDLISCTYGENVIIRETVTGIIDTGTDVIYLAQDLFDAYKAAIPGATEDEASGLIEIPPASIEQMQSLHFKMGDHMFTLDVDAQLLPPEMNEKFGGQPGKRYGLFVSNGPDSRSGSGLDFTLGMPFLKIHYTAFDAKNKRFGFAKAKQTL